MRKVIGSSPISSTIHEKSELLHDRKCVRIFYLYQRHYILMLKPRGFSRPLGLFYFIHTLEVPVLSSYNEVINKNKEELHMKQPKRILILGLPEYRQLLQGLICCFRNKLIQQGRYTDAVDELLIKLQKARRCRHG